MKKAIIEGVFTSPKEAKEFFSKLQEKSFKVALEHGEKVSASKSHLTVGDIKCIITNDTVNFIYDNISDKVQKMSSLITIMALKFEPNVIISGIEF